MTTRICCPFDVSTNNSNGGVVVGGCALVDVVADPWDGMTCVLPLDEVSDGTEDEFVDRTRNHFNGQGGDIPASVDDVFDATTCPTLDNGVFCQPSQHFDGRQLINVEQDNITGNHDFTVSLWSRFELFGKTRTFYSRGSDDGTNQYVLAFGHNFLNSPQATFRTLGDAGSAIDQVVQSAEFLTVGTWYHLAVTYSHNTVKLYVNGELVRTLAIDGDLINLGNGCFLAQTNGTANLQGNLQEFRLHPVARSANWLKAEYDSFCEYFVEDEGDVPLFYW